MFQLNCEDNNDGTVNMQCAAFGADADAYNDNNSPQFIVEDDDMIVEPIPIGKGLVEQEAEDEPGLVYYPSVLDSIPVIPVENANSKPIEPIPVEIEEGNPNMVVADRKAPDDNSEAILVPMEDIVPIKTEQEGGSMILKGYGLVLHGGAIRALGYQTEDGEVYMAGSGLKSVFKKIVNKGKNIAKKVAKVAKPIAKKVGEVGKVALNVVGNAAQKFVDSGIAEKALGTVANVVSNGVNKGAAKLATKIITGHGLEGGYLARGFDYYYEIHGGAIRAFGLKGSQQEDENDVIIEDDDEYNFFGGVLGYGKKKSDNFMDQSESESEEDDDGNDSDSESDSEGDNGGNGSMEWKNQGKNGVNNEPSFTARTEANSEADKAKALVNAASSSSSNEENREIIEGLNENLRLDPGDRTGESTFWRCMTGVFGIVGDTLGALKNNLGPYCSAMWNASKRAITFSTPKASGVVSVLAVTGAISGAFYGGTVYNEWGRNDAFNATEEEIKWAERGGIVFNPELATYEHKDASGKLTNYSYAELGDYGSQYDRLLGKDHLTERENTELYYLNERFPGFLSAKEVGLASNLYNMGKKAMGHIIPETSQELLADLSVYVYGLEEAMKASEGGEAEGLKELKKQDDEIKSGNTNSKTSTQIQAKAKRAPEAGPVDSSVKKFFQSFGDSALTFVKDTATLGMYVADPNRDKHPERYLFESQKAKLKNTKQ